MNRGEPSPLAALVCGYERGGTTLLGAMLKRHPALDSAFEGGLLLAPRPAEFRTLEPYASNLEKAFRLSDLDFAAVCDAPTFAEAYEELRTRSPVLTRPGARLFDKTPRYLEQLGEVLDRMATVPCVVLSRDPAAVLASWMRRSPMQRRRWLEDQLETACARYVRYYRGYAEANVRPDASRLLHVRYEQLCLTPETELRRIVAHLGLEFTPAMLSLSDGAPLHRNLRGHGLSTDFVYDYAGLDRPSILRIRELTSEARAFHFPRRAT